MNRLTDAELVRGLRARDPAALAALVDAYATPVYRLAHRILAGVGATEDVEECASDAFYRAWSGVGGFDPARAPLRTWLLILARSAALDRRRRLLRRPEQPAPAPDPWDPEPGPDQALAAAEERREVQAALDRLPPLVRELVYRRYFIGEPVAELARNLGLTRQAADNRLWRARRALRAALDKQSEVGGHED